MLGRRQEGLDLGPGTEMCHTEAEICPGIQGPGPGGSTTVQRVVIGKGDLVIHVEGFTSLVLGQQCLKRLQVPRQDLPIVILTTSYLV